MRALEEQTALITGATDGLGRALASALAAAGAAVLIHGRDEARGRQTIGALEAATGNGKLRWLRADFASRAPTSTDYSRPTLIRRLAIPPRADNFES